MMMLRAAMMSDSDMLLAWRNDAGTRAASRNSAEVSREDHERWMKLNVEHGWPAHIVMIAETDEGRIGVVRFDTMKGDVLTAKVSITIAPKFRGKGLAATVLQHACDYMDEYTLYAEIRPENDASIKIFKHCGFEHHGTMTFYGVESNEIFHLYKREPL